METNTYQNDVSGVNFYSAKIDDGGGGSGTTTVITIGVTYAKGAFTKRRALFNVDITDIPDTAHIVEATLTVEVDFITGSGSQRLLSQLSSEEWVKDSGSLPTWTNKSSGNAWTTEGGSEMGDRVLDVGLMPGITASYDMDVTWLASTAHRKHVRDFNLIVYSGDEGVEVARSFRIHSSEGTTKPLLTITYVEGNGTISKTRSAHLMRTRKGRKKKIG